MEFWSIWALHFRLRYRPRTSLPSRVLISLPNMSLILVTLVTVASFQPQFSVLAAVVPRPGGASTSTSCSPKTACSDNTKGTGNQYQNCGVETSYGPCIDGQSKDPYKPYRECSIEFQCGNITGIGYPWWGSSRPSHCGHPDFQLNCSGQTANWSMSGLTYQVLNIDMSARGLTLARTDYLTGICPQKYHNDSINATLFTYNKLDNLNVTIYYGCSSTSTPSGEFRGLSSRINCTDSRADLRTVYYVVADVLRDRSQNVADSIIEDLDGACLNRVVAPAHHSAASASLWDDFGPDEDKLVEVLSQGFVLVWDTYNSGSSCTACEASDGACGYNNGTFRCYCSDGEYQIRCNGTSPSPGLPHIPPDSNVDPGRRLPPPRQPRPPGGGTSKMMIIAGSSAAAFVILLCLLIGFWLLIISSKRRNMHSKEGAQKSKQQNEAIKTYIINYQSKMPQRYSYSYIKKMTKKFALKLGQGGFGGVYKGELLDGRLVAVKVLHKSENTGEEFLNEVASIGRTSHVNIVSLLGYCYDKKNALVYQYMPKGSLDKFIYQQESQGMECALEWNVLYDIAVGTARGLEYLHRGCNTRIVHLDIKPHNILLDEDFCPKISDFGLAKLCKGKESKVSMFGPRGTPGYIAPEVFIRNFGVVSYKSDVYSYGMLVLEMVGARKNFKSGSSDTSDKYFPDWIYEQLEHGEISYLGREIAEIEEEEIARKMTLVGLWCIQAKPLDRPNMTKVIEMLEDNSPTLPMPPKVNLNWPARSTRQYCSTASLGPCTSSRTNEDELHLEPLVESQP